MHITDDAFILKLTKYQETSYIASILTAEHGMIHTISKGVRSSRKNSKGNLFEVGNQVQVELQVNPLKNLQYLQKIEFKDSINQGLFAPVRQSIITYIMELTEKSIFEQSATTEAYELLLHYFTVLKSITKDRLYCVPLLYSVHLYQVLGYQVDLWLDTQELDMQKLEHDQLRERNLLLDNFLHYANDNFQPLKTPKSLEVIRSFLVDI